MYLELSEWYEGLKGQCIDQNGLVCAVVTTPKSQWLKTITHILFNYTFSIELANSCRAIILGCRLMKKPLSGMLLDIIGESKSSLKGFMPSFKCSSLELTPITFIHNSLSSTNPRLHSITRGSINTIPIGSQKIGSQRYLVNNRNDYHTWFKCLSMTRFTQSKDMRRR